MSRLPTQESCAPKGGEEPDPREVFQWAFVSLPFAGSTPLIVQDAVRPEWSQLFWDLGFRHHPELQTKKIRPPHRGQQHSLNGSVLVVDVDDPDPDPVVIQDPAALTAFEQEIQLERYRQLGRIPEPNPVVEGAEELSGDLFDPADHTPSTVNGYLMAAQPVERRRVIAAEMTGKKRDQILRKWRDV